MLVHREEWLEGYDFSSERWVEFWELIACDNCGDELKYYSHQGHCWATLGEYGDTHICRRCLRDELVKSFYHEAHVYDIGWGQSPLSCALIYVCEGYGRQEGGLSRRKLAEVLKTRLTHFDKWRKRYISRRGRKAFGNGSPEKKELLEKFGASCYLCGKQRQAKTLQVEHMHPVSRGGSNNIENLALACKECNREKGTMTVEEYLAKKKDGAH